MPERQRRSPHHAPLKPALSLPERRMVRNGVGEAREAKDPYTRRKSQPQFRSGAVRPESFRSRGPSFLGRPAATDDLVPQDDTNGGRQVFMNPEPALSRRHKIRATPKGVRQLLGLPNPPIRFASRWANFCFALANTPRALRLRSGQASPALGVSVAAGSDRLNAFSRLRCA